MDALTLQKAKNYTNRQVVSKMDAINANHFFADNTARDAYFVTNPTELADGLFISSDDAYQIYNGVAWVTKTPVSGISRGEYDSKVLEFDEHKLDYVEQVGTVANLTTTSKEVVGAVNELNTNKANIVQEAWVTPTLLNGWVQDETNYPVGYMKDQFGFVHFRGRVKDGAGTMFILPTGYKPNKHISFTIVSDMSAYAKAFGVVRYLVMVEVGLGCLLD